MAYNELLNKIIENSKLSLKEISERCKSNGVNLTPAYLSILKTNKDKVASDEISRAIAVACGVEYKDILVIESYLDKAPKEIIKTLTMTKYIAVLAYRKLFKGMPKEYTDKMLNDMMKATLAEFVCMSDNNEIPDTLPSEIAVEQPIRKIEDDSMGTIIPNGSSFIFTKCDISDCKNGDIIYYHNKKDKADLNHVRMCYFTGKDKVVLVPQSREYPITEASIKDIELFGKVHNVMTDIL